MAPEGYPNFVGGAEADGLHAACCIRCNSNIINLKNLLNQTK
jgi:hypothetical protein